MFRTQNPWKSWACLIVIMVMVLVKWSQGNSPDIDSLNRLIESEFHTREPGGVKTRRVWSMCPVSGGTIGQWSAHAHNVYTREGGTWSRGFIGVTCNLVTSPRPTVNSLGHNTWPIGPGQQASLKLRSLNCPFWTLINKILYWTWTAVSLTITLRLRWLAFNV